MVLKSFRGRLVLLLSLWLVSSIPVTGNMFVPRVDILEKVTGLSPREVQSVDCPQAAPHVNETQVGDC